MAGKTFGSGGSAQKGSTATITILVFVVGLALIGIVIITDSPCFATKYMCAIFIGINYWHAMKCVPVEQNVSSDLTDVHIASLERRLLAAEAKVCN